MLRSLTHHGRFWKDHRQDVDQHIRWQTPHCHIFHSLNRRQWSTRPGCRAGTQRRREEPGLEAGRPGLSLTSDTTSPDPGEASPAQASVSPSVPQGGDAEVLTSVQLPKTFQVIPGWGPLFDSDKQGSHRADVLNTHVCLLVADSL